MKDIIKFGPAGNPEDFYSDGLSASWQMPQWLAQRGLNAYEYQCGRGVKISPPSAKKLGELAVHHGVHLSVHAPYFINLATQEPEKVVNSIRYITDTLAAAKNMGATRVVVHSGACGKITRQLALATAKATLARAIKEADDMGFGDIHICPETMGKIQQLGDLNEVMELCSLDERLIPTIDFGHLNARSMGQSHTSEHFENILDTIENKLGIDRLRVFHSHFSKIEYTKGGEKKHLTFEDQQYGPNFEPLAEIVARRNLTPTFICESAGTQAIDAVAMRDAWRAS